MTNDRKTICLVTNWYPSKENPYIGVFFKEQAFALRDEYRFIVVHYEESAGRLFAKSRTELVNEEQNTIEYKISVKIPVFLLLYDLIHGFVTRYIRKTRVEGVGEFVSGKRKAFTEKHLCGGFAKNISQEIDAFYCVDAQKEAFWLKCLADHYQKPYMIGEHAPVPWPGTVLSDLNKDAIEKADVFLAIGVDKIRQLMMLNLRLPPIQYIGNLINEDQFQLAPFRGDHIKSLMIVAANSFYKNYDMFIRVMEKLKAITDVPFKVYIVGYSANKGYSRNVKELEDRVSNSAIADITKMIPAVPHEKLGDLYHKADVFVMTSVQEGQPVSAMEAACCGLPVFSTRCGGVEDYVDESVGRIYGITDVEGMAQGLKAYLEGDISFSPEKIRETVVRQFGKKAFVNHFNLAFETAVRERKRKVTAK